MQLAKSTLFFAMLVVLGTACTRPNPDACCTNDAECAALGSSELRPCGSGQVCSNNLCQAVQCETGADCSAAAPYCVNQLCVGRCQVDGDCAGVPGAPLCASDHVCVGCRGAEDCSGATAICDTEDRTCRGCENDLDCASGICLEADGVCARDDEVVFVTATRGSDNGLCTRELPCATLSYALGRVTAQRKVIRVGGPMTVASTFNPDNKEVYIDANNALLSYGNSTMPIFQIGTSGKITIEGVSLGGVDSMLIQGFARLRRVTIASGATPAIKVVGGRLIASKVELERSTECNTGGVVFSESVLGNPTKSVQALRAENCDVSITRSKMSDLSDVLRFNGGVKAIIENNLFLASDPLSDLITLRGASAGSSFQFNTVVNLSGTVAEGNALACDANTYVANNIFAYFSTSPHQQGCATRYSLYDKAAGFVPGEGNVVADFSMFFVDPANGDYRPAATSPARGMAESAATLMKDFSGGPRPLPAGSRADVGAFEVP